MKFWRKKKQIARGHKPSTRDRDYLSTPLFLFALAGLLFGSLKALGYKTWTYADVNGSNTNTTTVVSGQNTQENEEEEQVLKIDPEQLEKIVNTIAYTHAVWPGYKGDLNDGFAVRKYFSENLARVIINNSRNFGDVDRVYKVHFYYVVRDDGAIQFLSLVNGGRTSEDVPLHLIKNAQNTMSIGIPGIQPGTDDKGDPITVIYQLVISYTPA